jgi:putative ABC transport system permease protein
MNPDYLALSWWQVAVAACLILINAGTSWWLHLGLGRRLFVAATRMTVQLWAIGLVLRSIFAIESLLAVLGMGLVMTLIAGISAAQRVEKPFAGMRWAAIVSVGFSSWIIAGLALTLVVEPTPWWRAQYAIPLLGMVLGNALTGIALGLDRFADQIERARGQIEAALALGATRWEAVGPVAAAAIRTGMIPILNTMAVAGIVSLPGMMTGQLLAGVAPVDAVRYQIVIMFMIAAAIALGTMSAVLLSYRLRTTAAHQVRPRGK